jgi:type III restriction enzyme
MSNPFFDHPILYSPYVRPLRHWELDADGQPTQKIIETRRRAEFITPIPKPKTRKGSPDQQKMVFDEGRGLSDALPNPAQWLVTPETVRLLQHWRHHKFSNARPFFCQVEAVETAIWLTEVAPQSKSDKRFLDHLVNANRHANPELLRLALKLATGAGKTTVMAMLIAWQTINSVRRSQSSRFSRGFLVVTPGLTIKDPGAADDD